MKPKITKAMLDAAEDVLNEAPPLDYHLMTETEQRQARRAALRGALAAALSALRAPPGPAEGVEEVGCVVDAGDFVDFEMNHDLTYEVGDKLYRFSSAPDGESAKEAE